MNLTKDFAVVPSLERVSVAFEWKAEQVGGGGLASRLAARAGVGKVDLDLAAVAYNNSKEPVVCANVRGLDPFDDGTLRHRGNTAAKAGEASRETVDLDLVELHKANGIVAVCTLITAAAGAEFGKLALNRIIVRNEKTGEEQRALRSIAGAPRAAILVCFRRDGDGSWRMAALSNSYSTAYSATSWRPLAAEAAAAVFNGWRS